MFGKKAAKRKFGYTPVHTEITDKDLPLRERMKFTPLSSQAGKNNKRKTIILTIFLIVIIAVIVYFGVSSLSVEDIQIKEEDFEKITS